MCENVDKVLEKFKESGRTLKFIFYLTRAIALVVCRSHALFEKFHPGALHRQIPKIVGI